MTTPAKKTTPRKARTPRKPKDAAKAAHPSATRLILCTTPEDVATVDTEAGELAVIVEPELDPANLEAILTALGPAAGAASRSSAPDVPAALSAAWARRYARAARPPEE